MGISFFYQLGRLLSFTFFSENNNHNNNIDYYYISLIKVSSFSTSDRLFHAWSKYWIFTEVWVTARSRILRSILAEFLQVLLSRGFRIFFRTLLYFFSFLGTGPWSTVGITVTSCPITFSNSPARSRYYYHYHYYYLLHRLRMVFSLESDW